MKPKYVTSNNLWYSKLIDYDPNKYIYNYDTSLLVDGDMSDKSFNPWVSNIAGYDKGRYVPTSGHGAFGVGKEHYNYTKGVEESSYYRKFGNDILDADGNFTPLGELWAKAVDALIPASNHLSRFYDDKGLLRTSWSTGHNDAHSRAPKTFNKLKDYVNYVRNDQILGARHNVFLNKGKRYFYKDKNGIEHWVDPSVVGNYTVSKDPVRSGWNNDHTIYWNDYELTGLGNDSQVGANQNGSTPAIHHEGRYGGIDLSKIKINPANLLAAGRLAGTLWNNNRVFNETLKGIRPNLQETYQTHRLVYGDEGTKLYYYRNAATGESQASRATTSDAVRQMAQQMEAKRVGDDLRSKGDLADNEMVKRTSDESNQHEWANTLRRTETANYNTTEINKANAERHNLKALKWSADWTSMDTFLKEIEHRNRQRAAEKLNISDQIYALEQLLTIDNDPSMAAATKELQEAMKAANNDLNDPRVIAARKKRNAIYTQIQIDGLRNRPIIAEKGVKISYKSKDDLLYKTARDAVEHFRKMSKITSDALAKSKPKPIKLSSHPTRKMQQGGVAPFTVYTPVALGGETTLSGRYGVPASGTISGTNNKKGNDTLDLIKELFKAAQGKGLPVDVNLLYLNILGLMNYHTAFGTEMSTEDIASMYLKSMQQLNNIQYSKEAYDKAKAHAELNDALNEVAITPGGRYVVQDTKTGKLSTATLEEIKKSKTLAPVSNQDLLNLRAYAMPGLEGDQYLNYVSGGIGMSKIGQYIKSIVPAIKSDELKVDKYISNKLKAGIQALLNAPEGDYKQTITDKNSKELVTYALNYILGMLPKDMKAVLDINAASKGVDPKSLVSMLLGAETNIILHEEYSAITGKAADKKNGDGEDGSALGSAGLAFVLGQGPRELVEFNTGTSFAIRALAIKGVLQDHSNRNLGQGATLKDATQSLLGGYLQWNKATFGGSRLNSLAAEHIILNDSSIYGVDLPYTTDLNGNAVPDFLLLKKIEKAEEEISNNKITDYNKINLVYLKYGLPLKYDGNGNLNSGNYMRFAAILVTLDEDALQDKGAILSDEVTLANKTERDLYELAMKRVDKSYNLSDGWFGVGKDNLYKGTIFVPYNNDVAFAAVSSGKPLKQNMPNNAATVLQMLYAPQALSYKAPDVTLSQITSK